MPQYTITLPEPINSSLQVGDLAYYVSTASLGIDSDTSEPVSFAELQQAICLGPILSISNPLGVDGLPISITVLAPVGVSEPLEDDYIMFGKDQTANSTGLKGYYASITFKNDSTGPIELFSVSAGVDISSK
jgi:hypothetical protein